MPEDTFNVTLPDGKQTYILSSGVIGEVGDNVKHAEIPDELRAAHQLLQDGKRDEALSLLKNAGYKIEEANLWEDGRLGREASWMDHPPTEQG